MNPVHQRLCRSDGWPAAVPQRVPWVIRDADLGPKVFELGPGPSLTTDLLRSLVPQLTALEIDSGSAGALRTRLQGSNVRVIEGNATGMPFRNPEFSGSVSLRMLHHVPSRELQDISEEE